MLDTGATIPLLDTSTGEAIGGVHDAPPVRIVYAGGEQIISNKAVDLGGQEAYVVEGINENLFSPNKLVDEGYTILLDTSGGVMTSPDEAVVIPIHREKGTWRMWINDLILYPKNINKTYNRSAMYKASFLNSFNQTMSKRELLYKKLAEEKRKRDAWKIPESYHSSLSSHADLPLSMKEVSQSRENKNSKEGVEESKSSEGAIKKCREYVEPKPEVIPICKMRRVYGESARSVFLDLHNRMGHPPCKAMLAAISGNDSAWKNCPLTEGQIRRFYKEIKCPHCILAKSNRITPVNVHDPEDFSVSEGDKRSGQALPGEIISLDPVGIINPVASNGHKYFWLVKDVATGYDWVYTSKDKSAQTCVSVIDQVVKWLRVRGKRVLKVRTDFEIVLRSQEVREYCEQPEIAIRLQYSVPYKHCQNAVERDVQTCVRGAALMLAAQPWLRKDCWHLALLHYVDVRNRIPNERSKNKSPLQLINGEKLDLNRDFKFAFGDFLAVCTPEELKTGKFDLRNQIGIYVGSTEDCKGGNIVYWPFDKSTSIRYDCVKIELTDEQFLHYYYKKINETVTTIPYEIVQDNADIFYDYIKEKEIKDHSDIMVEERGELAEPMRSPLYDEQVPPRGGHEYLEPQLRQSVVEGEFSRKRKKPRVEPTDRSSRSNPNLFPTYATHINASDNRDYLAYFHEAFAYKVTVGKALQSEDSEKWADAIRTEISLLLQKTLEPVARDNLPENKQIIHSTMQLKLKLLQSGAVDKYKARLCACGNELWTNSAETYSPTIGALAYATVHQIAVIDRMAMCTVDTIGAYLYESYPDSATPLYLTLPANVAAVCGLDPNQYYRIRKYLYGLPDSGRAYYKAYSTHLESYGYMRTISDPCLFVKITDNNRTYVFTHVDDTFVCSTDSNELVLFQNALREKYEITVTENVTEYLGIKMTRLPSGDVKLTQPKLLESIFDEHKEEISSMANTMAPQHLQHLQDTDSTPIDQSKYLHLLGALIYITKSRPDIATAVSFGATCAATPTVGAYRELLLCVKYLSQTRDNGLTLKAGEPNRELKLKCYVDASYLTHADSKSHTGFCLSFGEVSTFYTKSSKQTLVTTSSTHAEMRALYSLVIEIVYVMQLCIELRRPVKRPAIVMEDNQPVIDLTADFSSRTKKCKHFLMLVNYIKEQVDTGLIELQKVPTTENVADILTKIVVGNDYRMKAMKLLGT